MSRQVRTFRVGPDDDVPPPPEELIMRHDELVDPRWFDEEGERAFALPATVDNGDVECELCGQVHEADVDCE